MTEAGPFMRLPPAAAAPHALGDAWIRLRRNRLAVVGGIVILLVALAAYALRLLSASPNRT